MNPWEREWGAGKAPATAAPWEREWGDGGQAAPATAPRVYSFADDIKKLRADLQRAPASIRNDESNWNRIDEVERAFRAAKPGDVIQMPTFGPVDTNAILSGQGGFTVVKKDDNSYVSEDYKGPNVTEEDALAIAAATSVVPGAAGMAGVRAGAALMPKAAPAILRGGAQIAGAITGAVGVGLAQHKGLEALNPELAEKVVLAAEQHPGITLAGETLGGAAPFQRIRAIPGAVLKSELLQRGVGAGIMGGIQGVRESQLEDPSAARVMTAAGVGALFNDPTRMGSKLSGMRITPQLGKASTKATRLEATQAANEMALQTPEGVPFEMPPSADLSVLGPTDLTGLQVGEPAGRMAFGDEPGSKGLVTGKGKKKQMLPNVNRDFQNQALAQDLLLRGETGIGLPPVPTARRIKPKKPTLPQEGPTVKEELTQVDLERAGQRAAQGRVAEVADELRATGPEIDEPSFQAGVKAAREAEVARQQRVEADAARARGREIAPEVLAEQEFQTGVEVAKRAEEMGKLPVKPTGETLPKGEQVIKLGDADYAKIGGKWYRATGEEVTDTLVANVLERNLPQSAKGSAKSEAPTSVNPPAKLDPIEPVDIGPRDASVSSGTGKETSKEAAMMAEWKKSIAADTAVPASEFVGHMEGPKGRFELWNAPRDVKGPSGEVIIPKGSTVDRATLEQHGFKIPEVSPEMVAKAEADRAAFQAEANKVLAAKGTPKAQIPPTTQAKAPGVVQPTLKVDRASKAKGKAKGDLSAITPVEKPLAQAPSSKIKEADVAERTKIKLGSDQSVTIWKSKKDGSWYDASGNIMSGGSRQVAIQKAKEMYNYLRVQAEKNAARAEKPAVAEPAPAKPANPAATPDRLSKIKEVAAKKKTTIDPENEPVKPSGDEDLSKVIYPLDLKDGKWVDARGRRVIREGGDRLAEGGSIINPFKGVSEGVSRAGKVLKEGFAEAKRVNAEERVAAEASDTPATTTKKEPVGKRFEDSPGGKAEIPVPEGMSTEGAAIYRSMMEPKRRNFPHKEKTALSLAKDIESTSPEFHDTLSDIAGAIPTDTRLRNSKGLLGGLTRAARSLVGTIDENLRSIIPSAVGIRRNHGEAVSHNTKKILAKSRLFGEAARDTLSKKELIQLDAAALSGDRLRVNAIIDGSKDPKALRDALDLHQEAMAELRKMAQDSGRDVGFVDFYFPRVLTDREGLLKTLGREESLYDDLVRKYEREHGAGSATADVREKLLNNLVLGSMRNSGKPGWLSPRVIKEIDQNLLKFYEPFDVGTDLHVRKVVRDAVNREFFGKVDPKESSEITGSVGKYLDGLVRDGEVSSADLKNLIKTFGSYFQSHFQMGQDFAHAAAKARKFQTFAYLSDAITAIAQFSDFFNIWRKYGVVNTVAGYTPKLKGRVTLEDLPVLETSHADLTDLSRSPSRSQNPIMKAIVKTYETGLRKFVGRADEINKGALGTAARRWVSKVVMDSDSRAFKRLDKQYREAFGDDQWDDILKSLRSDDFKNGKLDRNSRFFLYNEVANLQPVDAGGRAELYNRAGPWPRLIYTLRTYPIQQLNVMRREVINEYAKGNVWEGTKNLMTYLALVGVGQQLMTGYGRDKLLGREVEPEDYAISGLLQLFMVPRYSIYRLKQTQDLPGTIVETALPGFGVFSDIGRDTFLATRALAGQRDKSGRKVVQDVGDFASQMRTIQYLPIVGRELYWWFGAGAESERKRSLEKAQGKERTSTLEELGSLLSPPDLKTEKRRY